MSFQRYYESMINATIERSRPQPTASGLRQVQEVIDSGSPLGREFSRLRSEADSRIQVLEQQRQALLAEGDNLIASIGGSSAARSGDSRSIKAFAESICY